MKLLTRHADVRGNNFMVNPVGALLDDVSGGACRVRLANFLRVCRNTGAKGAFRVILNGS